jgi:hypothetical protein
LQKKGVVCALQKNFFHPRKKHGFFADFANGWKMPVAVHEYGPSVNASFFDFGRKRVKNTLKKNIVSNLP